MNIMSSRSGALFLSVSLYLIPFQSISIDDITFNTITVMISGEEFKLELADNWQRRQRGLMFREELDDRSGMLFIYPAPGNHRIWMKNTKIPLTVIWLDQSARVIDVKKLEPCQQQDCPVYGVDSLSKYILEFNEAYSSLKKGDYIPDLLSL